MFGVLNVFSSWGLYLSVVFRSVLAMDSMSGTLVFLVWRSLSGSISIVVVSVIQPSKAKVLVPTVMMLWKKLLCPFFRSNCCDCYVLARD